MFLFLGLVSFCVAERIGSFIVIGDWGYDTSIHCNPSSGCGMSPQCQQNIANKMKEWLAANPDVKFVLNLGDSFYPAGVSSLEDDRWNSSWKNVYGDDLTNLRWYSVYGNHDYEGRDRCACGDPANDPTLCAQRVTKGMRGWYMPDLYYNDTSFLEELGVEIVALDTNSVAESACQYLPSGCSRGSCWANLNARYTASMDMLAARLKSTTAENVLVMNHYPLNYFGGSKTPFIDALKTGAANGAKVFHFGGHVHWVQDGWPGDKDISPAEHWLVGGGGGWGCDGAAQGFAAGIIDRVDGKTKITMSSQLVDHSSCCYHHVQEGQEARAHWEESNDNKIYRTEEWWKGQLEMNGLWNDTCGGLECAGRQELMRKWHMSDRLSAAARRSGTELGPNHDFSEYFFKTIEEIRRAKEQRSREIPE